MTNPKGAFFERGCADYMAKEMENEDIDRQVKTGKVDRGDIRGVSIWGQKLAVECKNWKKDAIPVALREAEVERGNIDGLAAVSIIKRHGKGKPEDQLVVMTLKDLVAILTGVRPT